MNIVITLMIMSRADTLPRTQVQQGVLPAALAAAAVNPAQMVSIVRSPPNPHQTQCIKSMVLESQISHIIVNLLSSKLMVNNELTILSGS